MSQTTYRLVRIRSERRVRSLRSLWLAVTLCLAALLCLPWGGSLRAPVPAPRMAAGSPATPEPLTPPAPPVPDQTRPSAPARPPGCPRVPRPLPGKLIKRCKSLRGDVVDLRSLADGTAVVMMDPAWDMRLPRRNGGLLAVWFSRRDIGHLRLPRWGSSARVVGSLVRWRGRAVMARVYAERLPGERAWLHSTQPACGPGGCGQWDLSAATGLPRCADFGDALSAQVFLDAHRSQPAWDMQALDPNGNAKACETGEL